MKFGLAILVLTISSLCYANTITRFKVEGKLTGQLKGKYAYLIISSNNFQKGQYLRTDIVNNSFVFEGKVNVNRNKYYNMGLATVYVTDKIFTINKSADIIPLSKSVNYDTRRIILEENVTVEIGNSVQEAIVRSGELNNLHSLFESAALKETLARKSAEKLYKDHEKEYAGNKEILQKTFGEYIQHLKMFQYEKMKAYLEIVSQYPHSAESLYNFQFVATINEIDGFRYQQLLEETWVKIPEDVKSLPDAKNILTQIKKSKDKVKLKEGSTVPDYTFYYDNSSLAVKNFEGKYLFIDFWTTWCTPCKAEHYYMKQAYEKYKHYNFSILQVSLDEKKEKWLKAVKDEGLPWINIRDIKGFNEEITTTFNFTGVPANFLIGPDGKIIARDLRGEALGKKLDEIFNIALEKTF